MPEHFIEQSIIMKCSAQLNCLVKEMLYIRRRKPTLERLSLTLRGRTSHGKRQKWNFCSLSSALWTVEWKYLYLWRIVGDIFLFLCDLFGEEKKFDSRTWFFFGKWFPTGCILDGCIYIRRGLQVNHGTVRKSAIFSQPGNQERLKWSNTAYGNKWSFTFKTKLCAFQVTKI